MKKRGFTLIELIIVIIIIGVLATLGFSQYGRMVEKSRGAEARAMLGSIRSVAATIYMQNGSSCTNCTNANIGVATGGSFPGPAATNCDTSHYFWYNVSSPVAGGFTALATRCSGTTSLGKTPNDPAAGTVQLVTDFSTGSDAWTVTGVY